MRIKKIEIFGFKSFADRAVIHIDEPITAIVGPNGCGKSNIIDAIRWCMGEQSAKHLRGKSMDDVIFSGSDTRSGAGMAEVSMTFENVGLGISRQQGGNETSNEITPQAQSDAEAETLLASVPDPEAELEAAAEAEADRILADEPLPVDFSQYGEVTVTRRLFRDGTSEYLLNKTPCRLRDITDFFLGTGVGTKAYAIIEQGRVGMIVSAKPEERRILIEEAAGITKFKKKKQAAERKMDQTRQNLVRVSDIVGELDKQVASLRRQAQKAERYKKYRAEVKDIELWSAAHRTLGYVMEAGYLGGKLETASAARDAANARLEVEDASIIAARAELVVEDRRLADLTQVVFDLENQVKLTENQIDVSARDARQAESQAESAEVELIKVRERAVLAEREHEQVAADAERLDEEVRTADGRLAEAQAAQTRAREELTMAERDLGDARSLVTKAQADIARQEGQGRERTKRRQDLELRLQRMGDELTRAGERHQLTGTEAERIGATLEGLRQTRLDLGEQKTTLEARLAQLKLDSRAAADVFEAVRSELSRARSRHKALSDIAGRYEGFARGTRALMKHKPGREGALVGLVADHVAAPQGYETAVEAILGDRLGAILVEDATAGADAIAWLKGRTEGRGTFVPVNGAAEPVLPVADLPEGVQALGSLVTLTQPALAPLFAEAVVVDTLEQALLAWQPGLPFTWVTKEGDLVDRHGVLVGGSRDTAGAGVLEQKREIRELEGKIAELDAQLADATAKRTAIDQELTQVQQTLETLRKDAHAGEMQLLGQEKDYARLKAEAERASERHAQLEKERDDLETALNQLDREDEEIQRALSTAHQAASSAEREQLGLIEGATMARSVLDEETARVTQEKIVAAQATSQRQAVRAQLARLENELRELDRRRENLEHNQSTGRETAAAALERAEELRAELVGLVTQRRDRAEALAQDRNAHEQRQAAVQVAEVELRSVRGERDKAAQEANQLELRLAQIAADRRHVEETIQERYRIDIALELQAYHLRAPVTAAEEARLRELRELIERMGEINLTAIDELEETSKRHEYLVREKNDLEQALGQLERAIAKINKVSRKRFRETFDAVNAKFKEIYPRLFRGGHAELRLVAPKGAEGAPDGDDSLLDAGVEIIACPPGKKNTTVELLSGGEKALTAVALIFSIFLIKPSPFCILDEVDAPLDEANVGRYNDMVREMTDRSQFVVITHNKRTMEIADSLYGVTMEEPGSSKLVNVQLRRFGMEKQAA